MLKENKFVDLSMDFSVKAIKLCESIKCVIRLSIKQNALQQVLALIFTKPIMLAANPILLPNFTYRSKNVMKLNIEQEM